MKIGLRIDVDTMRGTRYGVPNLCKILADNRIRATFFFSVGPDNMGRHLWRLARPAFLAKMLRSNAAGLYGWDILLRGAFWPGPVIGEKCGAVIRAAASAGHEIGLHAWDHYKWQTQIERWDAPAIQNELARAFEKLAEIAGFSPTCSAAPAWKCTDAVLLEKQKWPFAFNSDCRGYAVFAPRVAGQRLAQPQVPVTLPTYDEVVGRYGVTSRSFFDYLLSRLQPGNLNVLAIHAEAEGLAVKKEFSAFLEKAKTLGHEFCALGALAGAAAALPTGSLARGAIPGREGWASVQQP